MDEAARRATVEEVISDEMNIEVWSAMMKTTLMEKGLWDVVENGIPPDPSKNPDLAATLQVEQLCRWRDLVKKDMEALQILQSSLTDSVFRKTLSAAASAKDLWDFLQPVPEHESLAIYVGDLRYDEDMWMLYTSTTNHMSPHEKYFTNLDRRRKARVRFIDGSYSMAQGTGDVIFMTKKGKKTIKNVLFVPGIVANVLSVGQLARSGYEVKIGTEKWTIWDPTGKMFGETRREERGFFLRLQVIEA